MMRLASGVMGQLRFELSGRLYHGRFDNLKEVGYKFGCMVQEGKTSPGSDTSIFRDRLAPRYILFALIGGYAIGLFLWAANRTDHLLSFILTNQVDGANRLPLWLPLASMGVVALLWFLLAWVLALVTGRKITGFLRWGAIVLLGASLLAFLPILGLPDLEKSHPFLTFGLIGAMSVLAGYTVKEACQCAGERAAPAALRRQDPAKLGLALVVALTVGYIVTMSALTVLRHNSFMTHAFDLGIHNQVVYNGLHSGVLRSTQHGVEPINYLGEHFAPILYLVAPIYALRQDARTLLVLQSFALGIGAVAVYLLAQNKTRSTVLSVALSASYLLYPALHGVNTFDFHQIALVTSLLLFSLYFLETGRDRLFVLFLALALLCKEEVALTVTAVGLYVALVKRRPKFGLAIVAVGVVYFVVVIGFVMPALGGEAQVNRFAGLMPPGSGGFSGIAETLLTNPVYTANFIFSNHDKIVYFFQLLLPLVFLPLLAGPAWIIAVPALGVAFLSSTETQYTIGYHYAASLVPSMFFLAILGAQRLKLDRCWRAALAGAVLVASLAMSYQYGAIFSKSGAGRVSPTQHDRVVANFVEDVPKDATVSTLSDIVPHLSNRKTIYLFPIVNGVDMILFDTDPTANFWPYTSRNDRGESIRSLAPYLLSGEYGLVRAEDGVLLLKKGWDPAGNSEALQTLLSATYEAEDLPTDLPGSQVLDSQAREGKARVGTPELRAQAGKDGLIFGPYLTLPAGKYQVIYRLKRAGDGEQGITASLDVFSNSAGGPLAGIDVLASDFKSSGEYQDFVVDLETQNQFEDVELRVLYKGLGSLWVDNIRITPVRVTVPGTDYVFESGS